MSTNYYRIFSNYLLKSVKRKKKQERESGREIEATNVDRDGFHSHRLLSYFDYDLGGKINK